MAIDPIIRDHQTWLGYLQPDGLVVSAAALSHCQVILPRDAREEQQRFLEYVTTTKENEDDLVVVKEWRDVLTGFLEWRDELLYGVHPLRPLPESLSLPLPEFGEILQPTAALADYQPSDPDHPWLLLIHSLPMGTDLDAATEGIRSWSASPTRRFERLLRETRVPIGLLINGVSFRLLYAPRGENAGSLTFRVSDMVEVGGRPILAAFHMLFRRSRLLAGPREERLPALLAKSRAFQGDVSTRLSGQVLAALYELVRGFQAADERSDGVLLQEVLQNNPDTIYGGLLNTLMRLVFLLYAEDRGLMPGGSLYVQNYSVHGLFERLRADYQAYPDTMDHRYGAWAQLLALFQAVHGGCRHSNLTMPPRQGYLFDPERFPFLKGRGLPNGRLPLVADGVIHRVLEKLLILDGERLSYRTLDVEQIGSVYETMMGFRLHLTSGLTVALKPKASRGAPVAVDLDALLALKPEERGKQLRESADQKLEGKGEAAVKTARTIDDLLVALLRRIDRNATPHPLAQGSMVLQPSDERRRSGSHYTPRSLTEPMVQRTLEPILRQLGSNPRPEQILDLKILDPAAGSGAFLVAACRELGDVLVRAWHFHKQLPRIPADEDEVLHARRLVAQRCLYGVDRNPMAADLAKLSLWLATLARDLSFTFLDHVIRCGDSLVGLTRRQIEDFHWSKPPSENPYWSKAMGKDRIAHHLRVATTSRKEILDAGDDMAPALKRQKLAVADETLVLVRLTGDLVMAAFFRAARIKSGRAAATSYRSTCCAICGKQIFSTPRMQPPAPCARVIVRCCPFTGKLSFRRCFCERNKALMPSWAILLLLEGILCLMAIEKNIFPGCRPCTRSLTATLIWWPIFSVVPFPYCGRKDVSD